MLFGREQIRTASARVAAIALAAFFCAHTLVAQSADFAQGEDFFMRNEPQAALPFLERAVAADPSHMEGALYLAMCYEQLEKFDEAIAVYRRILPLGGDKTALIACNLGNIYFRRGNNTLAEQSYTQAIRADPAYAPAYLNRANTRIKAKALRDALPDYERYLALDPASSQKAQIERLISLIRETFAAEEIRRLMAEEASRADRERRQRLLNEALIESMPDLLEVASPPAEEPNEKEQADKTGEEPPDDAKEQQPDNAGEADQEDKFEKDKDEEQSSA